MQHRCAGCEALFEGGPKSATHDHHCTICRNAVCSPTMCKHVFTHPDEGSDSGRFVCRQGCYNGLTGREHGDKKPTRQRSASGRGNVADGIPCDMDMAGCELTWTCDNQVVSEHGGRSTLGSRAAYPVLASQQYILGIINLAHVRYAVPAHACPVRIT
jgi:hypothetical protein